MAPQERGHELVDPPRRRLAEDADELAERPVSCLKGTGGDAVAATELIHTDGPTPLNGWDTLTFAALAAGVRAVVWGTASILPEQCVELHRLLIDDIDVPAAVKAGCRLAGDTTGPGREPLLELDDASTAQLAVLLETAALVTR
jgi:dihydrodipicolinate synthase/N-acetylneuraminate lyase